MDTGIVDGDILAEPVPPPPPPLDPDETTFSDDPVESSAIGTTLLLVIVVTWLIFGHKIQGMFRWARWISEGSMACLLGLLSGILLYFWDLIRGNDTHKSLSFNSATFFTFMLPPIIFYGGLAIKRRLFVSNLLSILAFGVVGTFIAFTILGAILGSLSLLPNVLTWSDCFQMAAIFAATDSVAVLQVLRPESHPTLYSIVLGEGVMNDATSVALLKTVSQVFGDPDASLTTGAILGMLTYFLYVFFSSFVLGVGAGLAIAMVMKHLGPFSQPQEVSLVGALAFLSYLLAEVLGLSGILALFFCGMAVSHYALQHIAKTSRHALLNVFRTLSYLLEGLIFLYVGKDALDPVKWKQAHFFQTLYLVVIIMTLVAVSRAVFVFPLAFLHNRWSVHKLSFKDTVVVWWAGMMRGAVSVAMVYYKFDPRNNAEDEHAATIVVTTLQVVLYSTVILGGVTGPMLKYLLPQKVTPPDVTGQTLFGGGHDRDHDGSPSSPGRSEVHRPLRLGGSLSQESLWHSRAAETSDWVQLSGYPGANEGDALLDGPPPRSPPHETRNVIVNDHGWGASRMVSRQGSMAAKQALGLGPAASGELRALQRDVNETGVPATVAVQNESTIRLLPSRKPSSGNAARPSLAPAVVTTVQSAAAALAHGGPPPSEANRASDGTLWQPNAAFEPVVDPGRPSAGPPGMDATTQSLRPSAHELQTASAAGSLAGDSPLAPGRRVQEISVKMLNAAQTLADRAGFEGSANAGPRELPLSDMMYRNFRALDAKYFQPVFGTEQRQVSTTTDGGTTLGDQDQFDIQDDNHLPQV